ncbi:hypothetical protein NDU88_002185 [Pleurodeles waltl]|uniref:Uncharacterized protein n=1 Tax=Pleurodeles waltl TaxID=8319 RepID=A0AAV7UY71_PLEWA|nr:hypothetical protein NDU88_002185 [Pleurodeles waltl]
MVILGINHFTFKVNEQGRVQDGGAIGRDRQLSATAIPKGALRPVWTVSAAALGGVAPLPRESGVRPQSWGVAVERAERRPGPRDGLSPGGPPEFGAGRAGGLEAHSGPLNGWIAPWALAPRCLGALEERGALDWGLQAGVLRLGVAAWGLVECRVPIEAGGLASGPILLHAII